DKHVAICKCIARPLRHIVPNLEFVILSKAKDVRSSAPLRDFCTSPRLLILPPNFAVNPLTPSEIPVPPVVEAFYNPPDKPNRHTSPTFKLPRLYPTPTPNSIHHSI